MARFNPLPGLAANPCYRIIIFGKLYEQTTMTRYDYLADWPGGTINDCAASVVTSLVNTMKECVAADMVWSKAKAELLQDAAADFVWYNLAVPIAGTRTGTADPALLAFSLYRGTGLRGQHGHGGIRISGASQVDVVGNGYVAGVKAKLDLHVINMVSPKPSAANPSQRYLPVIATYGPAAPLTNLREVRAAAVIAGEADPRMTSQRTRRPRNVE